MSEHERQQPLKEFRAGTITAAVWTKRAVHAGRSVEQHNIRIQKRYRDQRSGEWKTTTYFQPEDLPKLMLVVFKVYEHVTLKEPSETSSSAASAPVR